MILLLHIGIAFLSMAMAGYVFFSPSRSKLYLSYVLMAATLGTGVYLVVAAPARMLEVCTLGVGYLVVTATATLLGRKKLKLVAE
jgi:hypothetical protein